MMSAHSMAIPVFWAVLSASLIQAQDLSRYREFQFGTGLLAVAKQTGMKPSAVNTIHQRPAMIQELWWQRSLEESSPVTDSFSEVVFCFFNGELFRMVVNYDRERTDGLTDENMIEAISVKYGAATHPNAKILFSSSQVYNNSEKVIARWEDAKYSYNLFRYTYQPTFGMVVFSKQLDARAQAAIVEAFRLDRKEAPQRESGRQK